MDLVQVPYEPSSEFALLRGNRAIDPGVVLPPNPTKGELAAAGTAEDRDARIKATPITLVGRDLYNWKFWAREGQLPPPGDWDTWLILAGRGYGKTRAGAEWVRALAETDGRLRIALVAATMGDARTIMVEGESGLLSLAPLGDMHPRFEPSRHRLVWPNGAQAQLYSAAEPEGLRGAQHHFAWADEIGKWPKGIVAWDNLAFGLRLGGKPRAVVTTTPRAVPLVRRLLAVEAAGKRVAVTRGRMTDNRSALAPSFVARMQEEYGGSLIGRQELDGELIDEIEGALWSRALIERCRVAAAPDRATWLRTVIGVDPPAGAGAGSDACGIVVVTLADDDKAYVLRDASVQGVSPEGWAAAVGRAHEHWRADRVVAEANNGGEMVRSVLRAADYSMPVELVHASHGKVARAEPVAILYECDRVRHVGAMPKLEDEMAGLVFGGGYEGPGRSPDRADALVWALTELMLGARARRVAVRNL